MFIGGLNWDTTEEVLVQYFSKFGEVTDYTIMRDGATGKSRGFGFLTFKDPRSVDEVIKTDHILDGKLIDPKRAIAREEQDKVGKIFVGGIDPMVNEKDFNDFFAQFGSIIDAQLMIDKDTGRSRGFGFITYDSPDAVDRVTVNKYLTLKGKAMEVKRAEPRGQHQQSQQQPRQQPYGYNNQYGSQQYGQMGYQAPGTYTQSMNGMSPEMMQEYWQRMQQWYMYQQQQAGGEADGQEQEPGKQPLNPQQQDHEGYSNANTSNNGNNGPSNNSNASGNASDGHSNNGNGNNRDDGGNRDNSSNRDSGFGSQRRLNLPKGPRRAPPTGPSGGNGGNSANGANGGDGQGKSHRGRRGGYNRNRGFHPYRGGRRGGSN